ncbi:MAG TPA: ice-binding family protein, partial [Fluviicola sp.]|nr:ice-binding family protein [Fluviicola sp.]
MLPKLSTAQAPTLGTVADFVLFSSSGAVTNTGTTHLTGNAGTNLGASTGFGNIDGVIHDQNATSLQGAIDLTVAYNQLNSATPTFFPGASLGNGQTLNAGVYSIPTPATLSLNLNLDAQGDPNAVFIFQINGSFTTGTGASITLLNGAQACNVFWKTEGLVSIAAGSTMRGTIVANNGNITMAAGDTLEGRAISTNGAISLTDVRAYLPLGCGVPALTGPAEPLLGTTECFALFSSSDPLSNLGSTTVTGDIGSNTGTTSGYNPLSVIGTIHTVPDAVTAQVASDFTNVYNYLNTLTYDIDLPFPAQLGNNLVLTPHVYQLNGATTLTDTLYLDAQGNPNAVFVFQVNGSFGAITNSNVVLQNGAQAENVYWKIDGVTNISNNAVFSGTIVTQDDINLFAGAMLNGRALTGSGALTTSAATVTAPTTCAPLTITEPVDQTVCAGTTASFTVVASGSNLTYQWRRGNTNLVDAGNISGTTTATLTINPTSVLDDANDYNVIISGDFVPDDTSNFASLTVLTAPSITTAPVDIAACDGDSIAFVVGASGSGLTYQWRIGATNMVDGGEISGTTNDTLFINPASLLNASANYNVVLTGSCAPAVTSADVELTINTAPVITTQPTDQTACEGSSVSFSTVATGSGLTYQWQVGGVNITDGGNISGATTSTLTINPVAFIDEATDYSVIISGACAPDDTSDMVFLQVDTLTSITTAPVDIVACEGDSIAFVVAANGSNMVYQWQIGATPIVDGGAISGATNDTLFINPVSVADASANYNVVVTGSCAPPAVSADVELTINTAPAITTQPTDQTVCEGSSVSFSTTATGSGLTYQWQVGGVNITDGGTISGATTSTLTINPVAFTDEATDYSVIISGACAPADTSNLVFLEVDTLTSITTMPVDITACAGDSIAFVVGASGSNLTYQWQIGATPLIDGGAISGATNDTLFINPVSVADASANYNVVVSGSCTPSVTSADVELTINMAPSILLQPTDQTVCEGSSVSFST